MPHIPAQGETAPRESFCLHDAAVSSSPTPEPLDAAFVRERRFTILRRGSARRLTPAMPASKELYGFRASLGKVCNNAKLCVDIEMHR